MRRKIVFMAPYPTPENIKEGMMQRIAAVDAMFDDAQWEKSYVVTSFKSIKNSRTEVSPGVWQHNLSIWSGRSQILRLLNSAEIVYCHSLYGIGIGGLLYWSGVKCKNTIWDVHGIIPEELQFAGEGSFKVRMFGRLERLVARRMAKIVTVTNAMKAHLQAKYPDCKARFYTYAILPITIDTPSEPAADEVVILYAGNTQKYQNVPLMAQSIASLKNTPGVRFEILTGNPDGMRSILSQNGVEESDRVKIGSVAPSELGAYYSKAHYGYVLRDDIDVNNVACPTKIVEYLAYGLTPIVLHPGIGDFMELNYEYIEHKELTTERLKAAKSNRNIDVYKALIERSNPNQFKTFIES